MCKDHWRSLVPGMERTRSARLTDSHWTAKCRTACWLQRARKSIDNREWRDAALVSRRLWWARVLWPEKLRLSDLELLPAAPSVLHGVVLREKRYRRKKDSHWRVQRGERMAIAVVACQTCMATRCLDQLPVHRLLRYHGLSGRDTAQAVTFQHLATMWRCNVSRRARAKAPTHSRHNQMTEGKWFGSNPVQHQWVSRIASDESR